MESYSITDNKEAERDLGESIITLDVGGTKFKTSLETLNRAPYFETILSSRWSNSDTDEIFVDSNPVHFSFFLDYLRMGAPEDMYIPPMYRYLFDFFGIEIKTPTRVPSLCEPSKISDPFRKRDSSLHGQDEPSVTGGLMLHASASAFHSGMTSTFPPKVERYCPDVRGESNFYCASSAKYYLRLPDTRIGQTKPLTGPLEKMIDHYGSLTINVLLPDISPNAWKEGYMERLIDSLSLSSDEHHINRMVGSVLVDLAKAHRVWPSTQNRETDSRAHRIVYPVCIPSGRPFSTASSDKETFGLNLLVSTVPFSKFNITIQYNDVRELLRNDCSEEFLKEIAPIQTQLCINGEFLSKALRDPIIGRHHMRIIHSFFQENHVVSPKESVLSLRWNSVVTGFIIKCLETGPVPFDYVDLICEDRVVMRQATDDMFDYNWRICGVKPPKTVFPSLLFNITDTMFTHISVDDGYYDMPKSIDTSRFSDVEIAFHFQSDETPTTPYKLDIVVNTLNSLIYRNGEVMLGYSWGVCE